MTTWGATQWTAYRLGFQPQLGLPWFQTDMPIATAIEMNPPDAAM
jgi:type IV secretion system protein VirD4